MPPYRLRPCRRRASARTIRCASRRPDSVPVLYAYLYTPVTLGPYPSIVTIPGGGWTDGDATDMRFVAEYLAQRGFAVLAIEHRPAAQGGLEQVLADLHAGMRWMVRNARAHRLDMQTGRPPRFSKAGGIWRRYWRWLRTPSRRSAGCQETPCCPPSVLFVAGGCAPWT